MCYLLKIKGNLRAKFKLCHTFVDIYMELDASLSSARGKEKKEKKEKKDSIVLTNW